VTKNYDDQSIVNYNAVHKLKYFVGKKKTTYAERKKLSKKIVKELCNVEFSAWSNFFDKSKKKDDLSDCLLQGLDYIVKFDYTDNNLYEQISIVE
jgi:phosphopantetheine adenylyltransferase